MMNGINFDWNAPHMEAEIECFGKIIIACSNANGVTVFKTRDGNKVALRPSELIDVADKLSYIKAQSLVLGLLNFEWNDSPVVTENNDVIEVKDKNGSVIYANVIGNKVGLTIDSVK